MTSSTTDAPKRQRRMAREPQAQAQAQTNSATNAVTPSADGGRKSARERKPSKLDQVEAMLKRDGGASIVEMMEITGWQQHSVRGAMAGALRKRGLVITSDKVDRVRRYSASRPA